jgi:hypothetical protein
VCGCGYWVYGGLWAQITEHTREHLGYDPKTGASLPIYVDPAVAARKVLRPHLGAVDEHGFRA